MSPRPTRILVVGHDLHPGATTVLLDVCRTLRQRDCELKFVFFKHGPLRGSFTELGETVIFHPHGRAANVQSAWQRARGARLIRKWLTSWASVVYANSVASSPMLRSLAGAGIPVILHAHELGSIVRLFDHCRTELAQVPHHYVAASEAVRRVLEDTLSIDRSRTTVAYEGVDFSRIDRLAALAPEVAVDGKFVVGGSGRVDFGKGTDLWIRVAHAVMTRAPAANVHFVWCGPKTPGDRFYELLTRDIRQLKLEDRVTVTGYMQNQYALFNQFDVFALTSREDACPLVCLENLYLGHPVVCFKDSGGAPEIVGNDAGASVAYLDVDDMARRIIALINDPSQVTRLGEIGRERVRRMCSIDVLADTLMNVFETHSTKASNQRQRRVL